jgi:glyoxylase-like metal-dependent hydrolase (beta-lactamase superfamily II)
LHHQVFADKQTQSVFTGDTFGVSYREFDAEGRAFIMPTTTPSQFDPQQLLASMDRVLELCPAQVFLTHYSRVADVQRLGAELKSAIAAYVDIVTRHADDPEPAGVIVEELMRYTFAALDRHGDRSSEDVRRRLLAPDLRLNADGLLAWARRRRAA